MISKLFVGQMMHPNVDPGLGPGLGPGMGSKVIPEIGPRVVSGSWVGSCNGPFNLVDNSN